MLGIMGMLRANKTIQKKMSDKKEESDKKKTDEDETESKAAFKRKFLQLKSSETSKIQSDKTINLNLSQRQDRLADDKAYLSLLSSKLEPRNDISYDRVQKTIKKTTSEALDYLRKREAFWDQLELIVTFF